MKCTMMKQILALLSWGLICIPKEPEAFTFAKMEVGHPVWFERVWCTTTKVAFASLGVEADKMPLLDLVVITLKQLKFPC